METTGVRDPFADLVAPRPRTGPPQLRQTAPVPSRSPVGRRLLGVAVLLLLTICTVPVHVFAVFLVFIEIESPGDAQTAALLIAGSLVASFLALLLTATAAQLAGGFPGRWRARITFAVLSAVLSIAVATLGVVSVFSR